MKTIILSNFVDAFVWKRHALCCNINISYQFIPGDNEPSGCVSIHLANAERVKDHSVLWTHCTLLRCELDTPQLAAGSLIVTVWQRGQEAESFPAAEDKAYLEELWIVSRA